MKSHCKHGHAYTPQNTMWINGGTAYRCRVCDQARSIRLQRMRYRNDEEYRMRRRAYQREYWAKNYSKSGARPDAINRGPQCFEIQTTQTTSQSHGASTIPSSVMKPCS